MSACPRKGAFPCARALLAKINEILCGCVYLVGHIVLNTATAPFSVAKHI